MPATPSSAPGHFAGRERRILMPSSARPCAPFVSGIARRDAHGRRQQPHQVARRFEGRAQHSAQSTPQGGRWQSKEPLDSSPTPECPPARAGGSAHRAAWIPPVSRCCEAGLLGCRPWKGATSREAHTVRTARTATGPRRPGPGSWQQRLTDRRAAGAGGTSSTAEPCRPARCASRLLTAQAQGLHRHCHASLGSCTVDAHI